MAVGGGFRFFENWCVEGLVGAFCESILEGFDLFGVPQTRFEVENACFEGVEFFNGWRVGFGGPAKEPDGCDRKGVQDDDDEGEVGGEVGERGGDERDRGCEGDEACGDRFVQGVSEVVFHGFEHE